MQHVMLDVLDAFDDVFIPFGGPEILEQADEAEKEANPIGLTLLLVLVFDRVTLKTYRDGNQDSDCNARSHCQCCLFVVLTSEERRVLQCSMSSDKCQLRAA